MRGQALVAVGENPNRQARSMGTGGRRVCLVPVSSPVCRHGVGDSPSNRVLGRGSMRHGPPARRSTDGARASGRARRVAVRPQKRCVRHAQRVAVRPPSDQRDSVTPCIRNRIVKPIVRSTTSRTTPTLYRTVGDGEWLTVFLEHLIPVGSRGACSCPGMASRESFSAWRRVRTPSNRHVNERQKCSTIPDCFRVPPRACPLETGPHVAV
jgi:hypothetical protein